MRPLIKNALWLGAILALMTAFGASVDAQSEGNNKPPASQGGQGGKGQMGGGQGMGQMT